MLSLYSTAHSQRRAERGVARVKEASCSDTDRFGTDTNTRRQRHTSLMLMLRPTPRCSRVPSAVRAAVHHTHEACHPCGSRLCTVLYVPSLVRLPRSCYPSRGQGYRDNPPRCTAVEHAVKLVVEGQDHVSRQAHLATNMRLPQLQVGAPAWMGARKDQCGPCLPRSARLACGSVR